MRRNDDGWMSDLMSSGGGGFGSGDMMQLLGQMYGSISQAQQAELARQDRLAQLDREERDKRAQYALQQQELADKLSTGEINRRALEQDISTAKGTAERATAKEARDVQDWQDREKNRREAQQFELAKNFIEHQGLTSLQSDNPDVRRYAQAILGQYGDKISELEAGEKQKAFEQQVAAYKATADNPRARKSLAKAWDAGTLAKVQAAAGENPQAAGQAQPQAAGQAPQAEQPSVGSQIMSEKGVPLSDLIVPREIKLLTNPPKLTVDPGLQSPAGQALARARGRIPASPAAPSAPTAPSLSTEDYRAAGIETPEETKTRITSDPRYSDVGYTDVAKMALNWLRNNLGGGEPGQEPMPVVTGGPSAMPGRILPQRQAGPSATPAPLPWPGSTLNNYDYGGTQMPVPPQVSGTPTNISPDELLRLIWDKQAQSKLPWTYGNPLRGTQPLPGPTPLPWELYQ